MNCSRRFKAWDSWHRKSENWYPGWVHGPPKTCGRSIEQVQRGMACALTTGGVVKCKRYAKIKR